MEKYYESNFRKVGVLVMDVHNYELVNFNKYKHYIRILFLPADYTLTIDFAQFETKRNSLFFVNSNQYFNLDRAGETQGYLLYYNADFYCIQMQDHEVAYDGILFNNLYDMPMAELYGPEEDIISHTFRYILEEFSSREISKEEMIRTYLKQTIIRAARILKQKQGALANTPMMELEFFRQFSRLVEMHFREKHSVSDYADLLSITPKALSKKLNRLNLAQPNDIIKDRILLEARRMLAYSSKSIKEISYDLGYEDPAYFHRLFNGKLGYTPVTFRKKVLSEVLD